MFPGFQERSYPTSESNMKRVLSLPTISPHLSSGIDMTTLLYTKIILYSLLQNIKIQSGYRYLADNNTIQRNYDVISDYKRVTAS